MKPNTIWNLNQLKPKNDPEFKTLRQTIQQKADEFVNKWQNNDQYLKDPKVLRQALDDYQQWNQHYAMGSSESYYIDLHLALDQANPDLKAKDNQISDITRKISNQMIFFSMRIAKIDKETQQKFLKAKQLQPYRHFLEQLFLEAKYLLSEPEEKILNLASKTAYGDWVHMLNSFLGKEEAKVLTENGKKETKSFSEITSLLNSTNPKVRDGAAKAFNQILGKHVDVAENEFNAVLGYKKMSDDLRAMPRPDLARHLGDDIESEVVDTLIETVANRYDIAKRYYQFKAKLFNKKQLKYHERNVPYSQVDKPYSYIQALDLVHMVFSQLDPEFSQILKDFNDQGLIDAFPKKGKAGGAFCAHFLKIHPTYILLNHTDKLNDVLTLAHEAGHGINNELVRKAQPAIYYGTPTSTAEVASTFFEDFVLQELIKDANQEEQLSLLMDKLNDEISTIHRQIAFYKFEQDCHQEFRKVGYLSKETMGQLFQKHTASYMGDVVEQSPGSQNWWIYVGHFRRFFYVYSYAGGLLISKALQHMVKQNPKDIDKVKQFLSAGTSMSPKEIFAQLDIDITQKQFWNDGLNEVEQTLNAAEKLAQKLGKI